MTVVILMWLFMMLWDMLVLLILLLLIVRIVTFVLQPPAHRSKSAGLGTVLTLALLSLGRAKLSTLSLLYATHRHTPKMFT